ncbi:ABC transporter substrate-binding protein [Serratia entomophila]|uniref:ABC transporter substrate-binding protein n=1 Tax=Serratia entomophila TaxID=42906 RepID=UPI0021785243|nr:ABC transporter substrate-binding protein [Serratia entomophila]CAI0746016.1 Dipeptide-binding protein [Serratia entomophila]CAI1501605.1 Dipeptide-binding protein [Serratia entomophila]CAI1506635.1 Dipeptide-binding protein [Serratia entomophila]CAI1528947.1 Dipeptide-binding protein [Serratia entomophila]CAI1641657.1 Dipeptide-binding protein [Serratia entomophila]
MKRLIPTLLCSLLATSLGAQAATPKDTLVVVSSLEGIISLDPAESFETVSSANLVNLYQRLVAPDRAAPQKLAPDAAGSWQAGADGHSLIFTLKDNQRFASGNPLRPEDVIFSLVRAVKLNKAPSFILGEFGWTPDNVESQLKKQGDNQLQLSWPANIGSELALRLLTAPVASIVDEKLLNAQARQGDYGNGWLRNHSAGSGPYSVSNYVPHEALLLSRNDRAQPQAKLKTVLLKNVNDAGTRRLLLLKGDADVAYDLGADQFESLRKEQGVRIEQQDSPKVYYLGFNTGSTQSPALGKPALWQAARWLVDYQAIADQLLKGQYRVHQAFLPQGLDGAIADQPFRLDVAKAKQILHDGGIAEGTRIDLIVINQPPYTDIAQALQASFAKAGLQLDIHPVVESDLWGKMRGRDFQAIFTYWGADYLDPNTNTNASAFAYNVPDGPKTLAWRTQWSIPAISAETRAAAAEGDGAKRGARYGALQRELQASSPYVVALQGQTLVALRDDVKDAHVNIANSMLYLDQVSK